MSRARNLKPGFFQNDVLAECDPLARILFQGLWCEADRAGRLEDRPKKIKAACLPYDDCSVDNLLTQLEERGFIQRYVVEGVRYIQVLQFAKHQNPHIKEAASSIPAPDKHGARTVQAEESPERAGLIPSLLIPDSPLPLERLSQTEGTIGSPADASPPEDSEGSFEGHPPADVAAATAQGLAYVEAAKLIRKAGCPDVSASSALMVQALKDGITAQELADAAALLPGKPIKYLCTKVRGDRADAAASAGTVAQPAGSTRNTNGPSPRLSPDEAAARQAEALRLMEAQHKELGIAH